MERIGKYKIAAEIGRCEVCVVYRVRDTESGCEMALKTVHLDRCVKTQEISRLRERLLWELEAAAQLRHANLVNIHDFGINEGSAYVVTELVEDHSLRDLLAEQAPLSQETSLRILSEVAAALDYAHASAAIHGEVRPANILVGTDGTARITHFGLGMLASRRVTTEAGIVLGPPHYLAPEQIRGEPTGARTDQFGFAGVAYTLLTGRRPFDALTVSSLFHRVLTEDAIPVQILTPGIGIGVDRVLRRAMAKIPADRFGSCSDFVDALKSALVEAPWTDRDTVPKPKAPANPAFFLSRVRDFLSARIRSN